MANGMTKMIGFLLFAAFLSFLLNVRNARALVASPPSVTPTRVPIGFGGEGRSSSTTSSTRLNTISSTMLASDAFFQESDYVKRVEDQLIRFSQITDDELRRNDFEQFVTTRLKAELEMNKELVTGLIGTTTTAMTPLRGLDFVKAMDTSILKLGQSAQDRGWDKHVTSGFQPVEKNDIWPYVDMLIQFKVLLSNMERTAKRRTKHMNKANNNIVSSSKASFVGDIAGGGTSRSRSSSSSRTATTSAAAAAATTRSSSLSTTALAATTANASPTPIDASGSDATVGNGCKCPGCPGLNTCKDGKKRK